MSVDSIVLVYGDTRFNFVIVSHTFDKFFLLSRWPTAFSDREIHVEDDSIANFYRVSSQKRCVYRIDSKRVKQENTINMTDVVLEENNT